MKVEDVSISISEPDDGQHQNPLFNGKEGREHGDSEMMDIDCITIDGITTTENLNQTGAPRIDVLSKFQDWCVLQLSRGTGPRALLQWISKNKSKCFDYFDPACDIRMNGKESMEISEQDENDKQYDSSDFNPVLANPHYSAYAQNLVLVARNSTILKQLVDLKVTSHCLVKGYHKPQTELFCTSIISGKECATKATCLEVVRSNTAGHISLLVLSNDDWKGSSRWIAPRQFRRHLKAGGWPILGNAKDSYAFRGEPLCISTVRLEFLAVGVGKKHCFCIPPTSKLRNLLEREERFWREKRGQDDVRIELFEAGIPKPTEYVKEKATFDGLEFRITPAVMIPRKGSEALVERAITFYEKKRFHVRPVVLDLGTGAGTLLISILHRLRHLNAVGVGIDLSKEALELADYNIAALGLCQSATTVRGPFSKIHLLRHEPFNIVVCNPPYHTRGGRKTLDAATVTYEPDRALFVERTDALTHYRAVLEGLRRGRMVSRGALLVFEVFKENAEAVAKLMARFGLQNIQVGNDAKNCVRTVEGNYPFNNSHQRRE